VVIPGAADWGAGLTFEGRECLPGAISLTVHPKLDPSVEGFAVGGDVTGPLPDLNRLRRLPERL
jgi:hypothetical protein